MNIEKIKNGKNKLGMLQLISTNMKSMNKAKSETKHKDSRYMKFINYKILLHEKDNDILKLKNEIDYYKDCIDIKMRKKIIDGINTKSKKKLNVLKIINKNEELDIFKQKYDSMKVKKIKLIQKKKKNFTLDNKVFKNNNELNNEKNSYSTSLSENKSNLINFSINSINNNNNEIFNLQKSQMNYLENKMNNLMNNLFRILQSDKKFKK